MDMNRLAAKQKRIFDWEKALSAHQIEPELARKLGDSIKELRHLLARCWEEQSFSEQDSKEVDSLEARIDQLHEESRLAARNGSWS